MPTLTIDENRIEQITPFFHLERELVSIGFKLEISFEVSESEFEKVRALLEQYGVEHSLLNDILWFYDVIKNGYQYNCDWRIRQLTGFDECSELIDLGVLEPQNSKYRELLFGLDDKNIANRLLANLDEYESLINMIPSHFGFGAMEDSVEKREIQKIVFYTNKKDETVTISQHELIAAIFESFTQGMLNTLFLYGLERIRSLGLSRAVRQRLSERHKRVVAHHLHKFIVKTTSLGKIKGRNKMGAYLLGAHLMFLAGVEFPSKPTTFEGREAELMKDNFKSWVKSYYYS